MKLPSREQCIEMLHKHQVPGNVIEHSQQVERVAVFLAEKLRAAGETVDVDLVSRSALLHDICKIRVVDEGKSHISLGKETLLQEGLPEIAEVVGKHGLFQVMQPNPFQNWEEKIVYYADKRVKLGKIVSLDERFDYLLETYGSKKGRAEKIAACKPRVEELEEEIFSRAKASKDLGELK